MLTQKEADELINLIKILLEYKSIAIPIMGDQKKVVLKDKESGKIRFTVDMQRKSYNIHKITYQTRINSEILLRLDIEGPPHPNPDGTEIDGPHIHIYREGCSDSWAYPLNDVIQTDQTDLAKVLVDFLKYNHVENIPEITFQGGENI